MRTLKFKRLSGDCNWMEYGGKWISQKLNNGDFDYWLVLEFMNWHDAVGEKEAPAHYHVCVSVVAPSELPKEELSRAVDCFGLTEAPTDPPALVEMVHSYGISVPIFQENGNNAKKLLKEARKEAELKGSLLFGFAMDRPLNAIGTTGWDMLRGDLLRPLREDRDWCMTC